MKEAEIFIPLNEIKILINHNMNNNLSYDKHTISMILNFINRNIEK